MVSNTKVESYWKVRRGGEQIQRKIMERGEPAIVWRPSAHAEHSRGYLPTLQTQTNGIMKTKM